MKRKGIIKLCFVLTVWQLYGCADKTSKVESAVGDLSIDEHSSANFNEVRVKHLSWDVEVDFETKTISGTAKWNIENRTGGNVLVLDTRQLTINSVVLDNGNDADFVLSKVDSVLGQSLSVEILPETKWVSIDYTTSPEAEALQWLSPEQTLGKEYPYLFSQSQAILARTWIPCQDGPGVKFTYEAKVKTNPKLLALMSAKNSQTKSENGSYSFVMDQPISSYLLALTVGDLQYVSTGRNSGVYAEPDMLEKAVWELQSMQSMIDSAELLYGPYAWERYDVVILPPSFPFGGMENPRLTFATPTIIAGDRSLVALIAHELAHSWSGNLVTNETWNDFWLNEGFTVYFEQRIMEKIYGEAYAKMQTKLGMGELLLTLKDLEEDDNLEDTHLYLDLHGRSPDDGMTDVAYEKGRFFLQRVEEVVGRERFDSFLKQYFSVNRFKAMNTKRFVAYLYEHLLNTEQEQKAVNTEAWIYGPGLPDNCPGTYSVELDRVEKAIAKFNNNLLEASAIDTAGYTTHHWLYFLRGLKKLNYSKMESLDRAFHFTQTGNSEIACDWFKHCIEENYKLAYPAMESFLLRVGRRKFLDPLYSRLALTKENKEWATRVYAKARPGYHSVSANTIDEVLNYH